MKLIRRKPVHAAETFLVAVRKVEQGCVSENGRVPIAEPIMIATSTPRSTFSRLFAARRPCHNVAYGPRAIVFMPGMNTSPSSRNPRSIMGRWPMVFRVAKEGRGRMSSIGPLAFAPWCHHHHANCVGPTRGVHAMRSVNPGLPRRPDRTSVVFLIPRDPRTQRTRRRRVMVGASSGARLVSFEMVARQSSGRRQDVRAFVQSSYDPMGLA